MGRSIGPVENLPGTEFTHGVSKTTFRNLPAGAQSITRGALTATYPIAYRIGSGSHAVGHLTKIGEWLFQSPISQYPPRSIWGMAPGYETMSHPDFNRRVEADCLACHASSTREPLQPIGCEQCHGATATHLRNPTRATIVNPARLAPSERDAVCEQCHLNGEARIANPAEINSVEINTAEAKQPHAVAVYDRPRNDLRVVSHVEQLALSECVRKSEGKLWCGSCHAAHGEPIAMDNVCGNCHAAVVKEKEPKHTASKNCTRCHMPKREAVDGGHTAFTDHRIQRRAAPAEGSTGHSAAMGPMLRLWRQEADAGLRERNLGLALIQVGERDNQPAMINEGYRRLAAVFPRWQKDTDVLASMGMVLFLKDQKGDAAKLLRAALAARPTDALLHEKLGLVLRASGDVAAAKASLERSIALDPGRERPYFFLVEMQPTTAGKQAMLERLLRVFPQSLLAREALAALPRP